MTALRSACTRLVRERATRERAGRERAAVVPLVAVVLVVTAITLIGVSRLGAAASQRARADSVADVVALAAVHGGRDGARRVARGSGAELRHYSVHPDGSIGVEVQLGAVRANAAAAAQGAELGGDPDPVPGRR